MLDWIVLTLAMASADGEVVTYVHTDALGSPVAITDSHGNVIERFAYEPYGSVVGIAAADGPGYSGHVFDSTTGLNYMQQRYYSPEIGAFLSVDPVAAYGGKSSLFNRYRYANSSPYNFVDPDGRVPVVTRMKDGSVKISFPTKFSGDGATPKNIATFKEQVASMSGTYDIGGKETRVTVEVTDIDKRTPRAARNEIKLVNGETSHRSGRSFAELGGKKAEINVLDRFDKGVVPHEMSHLGGVDDLYDKTTGQPNPAGGDGIMNRVPGVIDSHAIGGIVEGDSAVQKRER